MRYKHEQILGRLTLLLGAVMLMGGCEKQQADGPAPAWELKDLEGKTVKSSDFTNKVVILDFWATWCPPCRQEVPGFISLQKKYGDQGLAIIGVALDEEGASIVEPFVKKNKVNYTSLIGTDKISSAFGGIEALPTTFVIDRAGKIAGKHIGYTSESEFERQIKPLLGK